MCFSDSEITRDEFIFYSKRLMRLLIEYALSMLPFKVRHWNISDTHSFYFFLANDQHLYI